jgi:hypothetical protein
VDVPKANQVGLRGSLRLRSATSVGHNADHNHSSLETFIWLPYVSVTGNKQLTMSQNNIPSSSFPLTLPPTLRLVWNLPNAVKYPTPASTDTGRDFLGHYANILAVRDRSGVVGVISIGERSIWGQK